jgi:hypothetical protein
MSADDDIPALQSRLQAVADAPHAMRPKRRGVAHATLREPAEDALDQSLST